MIDERLTAEEDLLEELELRQERIEAVSTLKEAEAKEDIDELERGFVEAVKPYRSGRGSLHGLASGGTGPSVERGRGSPKSPNLTPAASTESRNTEQNELLDPSARMTASRHQRFKRRLEGGD